MELLVADPTRQEQEGVVLAVRLPRPQSGGIAHDVLPVRHDHPPSGANCFVALGERGVDLHVGQHRLHHEEGDLAAVGDDIDGLTLGVGSARRTTHVVFAGVAPELLLKHIEVVAGDEDDRGVAQVREYGGLPVGALRGRAAT